MEFFQEGPGTPRHVVMSCPAMTPLVDVLARTPVQGAFRRGPALARVAKPHKSRPCSRSLLASTDTALAHSLIVAVARSHSHQRGLVIGRHQPCTVPVAGSATHQAGVPKQAVCMAGTMPQYLATAARRVPQPEEPAPAPRRSDLDTWLASPTGARFLRETRWAIQSLRPNWPDL